MSIDRKTVSVTDTIWAVFAGCDGGGPFARVNGGEVLAIGDDLSIAVRLPGGRIETFQNWGIHTLHATQSEAWAAAADRLQRLADEVVNKVIECRTKATGKAQEVATN